MKGVPMSLKSRHLIAAAVLAVFGVAAQAQTPPPPPPGAGMPHAQMHEQHMQQMQQHMQQRHQRRMESLKRILQIAPQQEGAWNAWTAAMRPAAKARPNREEFARMSTPERLDRMRQMRAQRNAEQDRRADATKAFYAQLSGPQQKAFDEVSLKYLAKRGHRGERHGH
jgi:protein CpxP